MERGTRNTSAFPSARVVVVEHCAQTPVCALSSERAEGDPKRPPLPIDPPAVRRDPMYTKEKHEISFFFLLRREKSTGLRPFFVCGAPPPTTSVKREPSASRVKEVCPETNFSSLSCRRDRASSPHVPRGEKTREGGKNLSDILVKKPVVLLWP